MPGYGAVGWVWEGFGGRCCCVGWGVNDGFCFFEVGHDEGLLCRRLVGVLVMMGGGGCVVGGLLFIYFCSVCAPRTKVIAGTCLLEIEGFPRMQADVACQSLGFVIG